MAHADRVVRAGGRFTVCFCGRVLHARACEVCGYELPEVRAERTLDELAEWRRAGRRAHNRRLRRARFRRIRAS